MVFNDTNVHLCQYYQRNNSSDVLDKVDSFDSSDKIGEMKQFDRLGMMMQIQVGNQVHSIPIISARVAETPVLCMLWCSRLDMPVLIDLPSIRLFETRHSQHFFAGYTAPRICLLLLCF